MTTTRVLVLAAFFALGLGACPSDTTEAPPADDVAATPDTTADATGTPDAEPETEPTPVDSPLPELWGPEAAGDADPTPGVREVTLVAAPMEVEIVDGVTVTMYAYNGQIPGPTIQAEVGEELVVKFENQLPEATTIHWHGVRVPDVMDGSPRIQNPVKSGGTFEYRFVVKDAGSFWYHPHIRANEQIEKGLYGSLVVHEATAPVVDRDRVLILDDILVYESGLPGFLISHPEVMHGRNGNVLLVNGSSEPVEDSAEVGQVERWRIVNTANARTMRLHVEGASWKVVGTDGGLLETPYQAKELIVPVGQRYDLEVTYDVPGQASLVSTVATLDDNNQVIDVPIEQLRVTVEDTGAAATQAQWPEVAPLPEREPGEEVWIEFDATNDPVKGLQWTMNGEAFAEEPLFSFWEGATVEMRLYNRAGPEHPFHLHGQFFEILRRNGMPVDDEPGLKDTVLVPGLESVVIKAYMDNPGMWMAHCHILEHAELGMMAEIYVAPGAP